MSRQTCVFRDKTFVATKMILVAAPASDTVQRFKALDLVAATQQDQ